MFGLGKRKNENADGPPYALFVEKRGRMKQVGDLFTDSHDVMEAAEDWLCDWPAIEIVFGNGRRVRVTQEQFRASQGVYI